MNAGIRSSRFNAFTNSLLCVCLTPIGIVLWPLCLLLTFVPIFSTRVGLDNLRQRLKCGKFNAHIVLSGVFFNYFCYLCELTIFQVFRANTYTNVSAFESFVATLSAEIPVVVLGAHLGNIESAGHAVSVSLKSQHNKKFYVLAKPAKLQILTFLETWIRKQFSLEVIENNRRDLLKCMIGTLKNKDALGLLIDQKPQSGGPFFELFGQMAAFPIAGVELGIRQQSQFIFVSVKRLWPGRFEILFDHVGNSAFENGEQRNTTVNSIMGRYVTLLESCIRANPSQWFWDYKKWSRHQSG